MIKTENEIKSEFKDAPKFLKSFLKGLRRVFTLWIISKGKIHGYGIMTKINNTVTCFHNPGPEHTDLPLVHSSSIYPILHSLEEENLIKSSEELNGKHKVKMYEITPLGTEALQDIRKFVQYEENETLTLFLKDLMIKE